ncbi:MAG: hypothetical protein MdMp014T_1316 [Treponematales bacterium]
MSVEFEEMKQILRETDKIVKENALGMAELWESQKETDRQLRELKAQVSGVSDNIGLSAEEYFQTAFAKNLNFAGIRFDEMQANTTKTCGDKSCEFDIVLVNHDAVALIEAKHRIHMSFPEEMATKKAAEFRFSSRSIRAANCIWGWRVFPWTSGPWTFRSRRIRVAGSGVRRHGERRRGNKARRLAVRRETVKPARRAPSPILGMGEKESGKRMAERRRLVTAQSAIHNLLFTFPVMCCVKRLCRVWL